MVVVSRRERAVLVIAASAVLLLGPSGTSLVAEASSPGAPSQPAARNAQVIYLVRHAETIPKDEAADAKDPTLSASGQRRAEALAQVLRAEPITQVLSTDYHRTQQTAKPLAVRLGLDVASYDPRALETFARRLLEMPGRLVVVGHSNTTPRLVELLGGAPGSPIDEAHEYDRLYVLTLVGDLPPTTAHLRYGAVAARTEETTGAELMRGFEREAAPPSPGRSR